MDANTCAVHFFLYESKMTMLIHYLALSHKGQSWIGGANILKWILNGHPPVEVKHCCKCLPWKSLLVTGLWLPFCGHHCRLVLSWLKWWPPKWQRINLFTPQTLHSCPLLPGLHDICHKNLSCGRMSCHLYIVNVTMVTKKMPPVYLFHTQMRQLWSPHVCQWYNRCELGWPGSENYNSFILIRAFK